MANPLVQLVTKIRKSPSGDVVNNVSTSDGHLYVARYLPDGAHLVNKGDVWGFHDTTSVTFLTTVPTTASLELLHNNEPSGGKSYCLMAATMHILTAGAAATEDFTLFGAALTSPETTLPTNDFTTRYNLKAGQPAPGSSRSIVDRALTLAIAPNWVPLGGANRTSAVNDDGYGILVPLGHLGFVLPPGQEFALTVVGTAAGTGTLGLIWAEHQFDADGN